MPKTIIYIDGQNFLYKVSERLISANLISDKQDIYSFDITGLLKPFFPDENLEIRYYGVKRIYHSSELSEEDLKKAERFSDSLRRFKNYLNKNNVIYVPKGSLKMRADEGCKNCGFVEYHFQEKGVDVGIAIDLIRDAITKQCDKIVLVSSDTDLLPAVQIIKSENINFTYISFSNQTTISLAKAADNHIILKDEKIREAFITSFN